jgi:hypothetical protein
MSYKNKNFGSLKNSPLGFPFVGSPTCLLAFVLYLTDTDGKGYINLK